MSIPAWEPDDELRQEWEGEVYGIIRDSIDAADRLRFRPSRISAWIVRMLLQRAVASGALIPRGDKFEGGASALGGDEPRQGQHQNLAPPSYSREDVAELVAAAREVCDWWGPRGEPIDNLGAVVARFSEGEK